MSMRMKNGKIGLPAGEKVTVVGVASGFQWSQPALKTYLVKDARGNTHRVTGHEMKRGR